MVYRIAPLPTTLSNFRVTYMLLKCHFACSCAAVAIEDINCSLPTSSVLVGVQFLPREAMLSAVFAVVVCLSICVSVTLRYCIKTAKRRITQTTPHDSP